MLHHRNEPGIRLRSGLVERVCGSIYFVADAFCLVQAECAPSCLLQPEKNDLVLLAEDSIGNASILTILERKENKPAMVSVNGDFVINGEGDFSLRSGQNINLLTPQIILKAHFGKIAINNFIATGTLLTSCGRCLHSAYGSMESKASKLVQRINKLYRRIGEEDSWLGRMQCQVRGRFSLCAQDAAIKAEKQMNLNGGKIDLG